MSLNPAAAMLYDDAHRINGEVGRATGECRGKLVYMRFSSGHASGVFRQHLAPVFDMKVAGR